MRIEVGGQWTVNSEQWTVNSEQWTVSRGQWAVSGEQRSVNINHWSLIIDHWYWHEVFCVCRRGKVRELAQRSMWCNWPCFQLPHVGGLIAISPYTYVFWAFANIHVDTEKTSWAWCEYVCVCRRGELQFALCCCVRFSSNRPHFKSPILQIALVTNSPTFQIAPISNHPHCKFTHIANRPHFQLPHEGGLIAISPYTCVFWTFANIHVNTQKKASRAWYGFVYVCRMGESQIDHTEGFVSKL